MSDVVRVKPLEWVENGPITAPSDKFSFFAECQTLAGFYRIGFAADGWRARFNGGVLATALPTLDAAKAAAQSNYDGHILSCLQLPA